MTARVLQTVAGTARRGLTRTHMLSTFAQNGGGRAVAGFLGSQARTGALHGAAGGAALGFGANAVGNMANGDIPLRGGFGAAFRGALGGAAVGSLGRVGHSVLGRSRDYSRFMGKGGAMGQFYRRSGAFGPKGPGGGLFMHDMARRAGASRYATLRGSGQDLFGAATGWFGKGTG